MLSVMATNINVAIMINNRSTKRSSTGTSAPLERRWPNPVVLKMTNVEPALTPPEVMTAGAQWQAGTGTAILSGKLLSLGKVDRVDVGFQYREKKGGTDLSERTEPWTDLPGVARSAAGDFQYSLRGLAAQKVYEYRARVKHPLITMYGEERSFQTAARVP